MIIDFHTHAFPDSLAETTVPTLEKKGNVKAALDGKITSLIQSMDRAGIAKSVLCSIATRPGHFKSILEWSASLQSERIIAFPSFHPDSPTVLEEIEEIHLQGFKGIKLHPYYQNFYLDEQRLKPIFAKLSDLGLIVVMHTGFDIGFPEELRADPRKIAILMRDYPDLKFIATHLGSWQQWDEVYDILAGTNVYLDLAFSLEYLPPDKAKKIIFSHSEDKILFGSDSPWADQHEAIKLLRNLHLGSDRENKILRLNAEKLLSG